MSGTEGEGRRREGGYGMGAKVKEEKRSRWGKEGMRRGGGGRRGH